MADLAEKLLATPTGTLLVIAGIIFLFIAVIGNVTGKIEPGKQGRIFAGVLGAALLLGGLTVFANKQPADTGQTSTAKAVNPAQEPPRKLGDALPDSEGAIKEKYQAMGGEAGPLGAPVTMEMPAANGGFHVEYQGGYSIYWTKETGAHVMHGAIKAKWMSSGGGDGALGYPTTDETWNGVGFQQNFKHCFMVWTEKDGVKLTPD